MMPSPIIWALPKLFPVPFAQQRPNWTTGLPIPRRVINRPWNGVEPLLPDLVNVALPSVVHQLMPYPPTYFRITGTTKDSTGAALGSCVVNWFLTGTDVKLDSVVSDANGLYEFRTAGQPPTTYYLVAYKTGSPDVAGTTVNALIGS